jgi:hypothetical protein
LATSTPDDGALKTVLAFLASLLPNLDALLCTGDIVDREGDVSRCCELLERAAIYAVRGNHDRWRLENEPWADELARARIKPPPPLLPPARAFLTGLPATRTFATPRAARSCSATGLGENDTVGIYPGGNDAEVAQALRVDGFGPLLDTLHLLRADTRTAGLCGRWPAARFCSTPGPAPMGLPGSRLSGR